jgi:hypothetical protein
MTTSPLRVQSGRARAKKASATLSGGDKRLGSSPGKARAAHDAGVDQVRAHPGLADLAGIDPDEHFETGLADRMRPQ